SAASKCLRPINATASFSVPTGPDTRAPAFSSVLTISKPMSGSSSTTRIVLPGRRRLALVAVWNSSMGEDNRGTTAFEDGFVVSAPGNGNEIFHLTPFASPSICALPPSLLELCSMSVVPKPRADRALTGGPPRSTHCKLRVSLLHVHITVIEPAEP